MSIMVTFTYHDVALTGALLNATAHLRGDMAIQVYEERTVTLDELDPQSEEKECGTADPDFGDNAEYFHQLLNVIRPKRGQLIRKHVLNQVLTGGVLTGGYKVDPEGDHRTGILEQLYGEPQYTLRAGIIGLSRSLRKLPCFYNIDGSGSPLSMLVTRRRAYSPNGTYVGIRYVPTSVGRRVYAALKNEGVL